jgi:hypothetical protein
MQQLTQATSLLITYSKEDDKSSCVLQGKVGVIEK